MVFPVGDENRRGAPFPYANVTLVAINILVFIYMLTLSQTSLDGFVFRFGTIPAQIRQGQDLFTLITSQFVHGGWLHIFGNLIFLWVFGDNIEAALGHIPYLIFYLAAGIIAALTHVLFNLDSTIPSIGASGAIAGVLGAYIVLFPAHEVRVWVFPFVFWLTRVNAVVFLGVWALLQLLNGLASLGVQTAQTGGVAVWAHVGGVVTGLIVGAIGRRAGRDKRG